MKGYKDLGVIYPYIKKYAYLLMVALIALTVSAGTVLAFGVQLTSLIDSGELNRALYGIIVAVVVVGGATFVRMYVLGKVSGYVVSDLRRRICFHVVNMSQGFFDKSGVTSIMSIVISDLFTMQSILGSGIAILLRNSLTLVGSVIMLVSTNARLSLYIAVVIPIIVVVVAILGRKKRVFSMLEDKSVNAITSFLRNVFVGIATVHVFNEHNRLLNKLDKMFNNLCKLNMDVMFMRAVFVAFVVSSVMFAISFVIWIGMHEVLTGGMTSGELSAFVFYAAMAASSINHLGDTTGDIGKLAHISGKIGDLLKAESDIVQREGAREVTGFNDRFVFKDVCFAYGEQMVIKDLNFTIKKGEYVALIGYSASGKSTVTKLLMRLYDVSSGSITCDGIDIRDITLHSLRGLFSFVSQPSVIFDGTIKDNISYGGEYSMQEIESAVADAQALSFIRELSDQFDSVIGESGIKLSEGQKQRIALARAMISNAEVLVLDEAMSALDSYNENLIHGALLRRRVGKTTVVVAHRLSTVLQADRIFVFEDGKVVESGDHKSLFAQNGRYAAFIKLQNLA